MVSKLTKERDKAVKQRDLMQIKLIEQSDEIELRVEKNIEWLGGGRDKRRSA